MGTTDRVGMGRRDFMRIAAALGGTAAAGVVVSACGGTVSRSASKVGGVSSKTLEVLTYGGPIAEVQGRVVAPLVQRKYGFSADITQSGIIAAKIASEGSDPKYALFTENIAETVNYSQIWSDIDPSSIPNAKHIYAPLLEAARPHGIPGWVQTACICYDERLVATEPTLADFADPKYRGKVVLEAAPYTMTYAPMILKFTGGTPSNPAPMFDWFKQVIPNVLTNYVNVAQPAQLFSQGDIALALWYSGRAAQLRATSGVPVKWVNRGAQTNMILMGLDPKYASDSREAFDYINTWLSPDVQGKMAAASYFGPVVDNASLSKSVAAKLPVASLSQVEELMQPDWKDIVPHFKAWQQEFDSLFQKYGS